MAGAEVFCNNCGHKNPLGANFCSSCGRPLERSLDDPTTITFHLDRPSPAAEVGEDGVQDEVNIDLDTIPPGDALLVVVRGPNAGARLALAKDCTTVGRHPDSDLFLDDITVSRRHAEFVRSGDGFVLRDVGSLNGSEVNRERVEGDTPLANGDEIQIGKYRLAYYAGR